MNQIENQSCSVGTAAVSDDHKSPVAVAVQVAFTKLTAAPGKHIAKGFRLDANGDLEKVPAASFAFGNYETVNLGKFEEDFPRLLNACSPEHAFMYSVCKSAPFGKIVPKSMVDSASPVERSRTKDCFERPEGACVVAIDVDAPKDGAVMTQAEVVAAFTQVFGFFKTTAVVSSASASSFLYKKSGEELRGLRGLRFYFVVQNGGDVDRVLRVMHARLLIAGFGRFEVSACGSLLERSLVDTAMRNATQPDFVGGSVCSNGVVQKRPPAQLLWGGVPLDSKSAIQDLSQNELAVLEATRMVGKARMKEVADRQREIWIQRRAGAITSKILVAKGVDATDPVQIKEAHEQAIEDLKKAVETFRLSDSFEIVLDNGTVVSVAEIKRDPKKFDGALTKDPREPEYDGGRTVGKIFVKAEGSICLYSLAHGGQLYHLSAASSEQSTYGGKKFLQTDLGNARHFVSIHGNDIRYCSTYKKFLTWGGNVWSQDEGEAEVMSKIADFCDFLLKSANGKKAKNYAKSIQSVTRMKAIHTLARYQPGVPVNIALLDVNPWLLAVKNGVVDLRTGTLQVADRMDLLTRCSPVEFDASAKCETFLAFLNQIMDGNQDMIEFLQRLIGYTLTGMVSEQKLAMCWGTGQNGKSTLLNVISGLMGSHGLTCGFEMLIAKPNGGGIPNDIARLRGTRYVSASETEEGARLAESLVKRLTGGDPISARFLFGEYFDFLPTHKLWLACNYKPNLRGDDPAIWRRLLLIPFTKVIPSSERDNDLPNKLAAEYPGILAWAVEGCLKWQQSGLKVPDIVLQASEDYKVELDTIGRWIDECCDQGGHYIEQAAVLYQSYKSWVERNGGCPLNSTRFGLKLGDRGLLKFKDGVMKYRGLRVV